MILFPRRFLIRSLAALISLTASVVVTDAAETKPEKNYAVGRVTLDGGKPLPANVEDVGLSIYGVTEAGEKVRYSPAVKNGVYRQKLAPGEFSYNAAKVKVRFGDSVFPLDLEPVGNNWNKSQESRAGIVQDFVWKPTGVRPTVGRKPDPNNGTDWYGMNVGLQFQIYRSDTGKAPARLPEGSKLVFTLTPTGKSIDGRDLKPVTLERAWRPNDIRFNDDLNDLPPANYELTGRAILPDGSAKPILFQGRGNYPKFVPQVALPLEQDNSLGGYWKQLVGWVTD